MQAIGYALAGAVIALGAYVIVRLIRSWRGAYGGGDAGRGDDPAA
jgi:hypothetical protein